MEPGAERKRLELYRTREGNWKKWGPYLSERAWGTVREDYSEDGDAWHYFPHDDARSRAYRWSEDGIAGISDRNQYLCFALALWNGKDPILKERLFGLTGHEGNHGEDVKELYFYLDSTPTHSYMKMLYRYPHGPFPYDELVRENGRRSRLDPEYELLDTGIFEENRYFDIVVEYAKSDQEDLFFRITATNRAKERAELHLLPTLWFRNTWSWGYPAGPMDDVRGKPRLWQIEGGADFTAVAVDHASIGNHFFYLQGDLELLFTENETHFEQLFGRPSPSPYVKDSFHRYIIHQESRVINPLGKGTKVAGWKVVELGGGESTVLSGRICRTPQATPFTDLSETFRLRIEEADEFYREIQESTLSDEERMVQRQAFAGLLWSKQLYYYDVKQWLDGDPSMGTPPQERWYGRNADWQHLTNFDVISMPDKWEYPWYATWDLAFHTFALVMIDPEFAKRQLILMTREWYMHPNGQLPAYEWSLGDANPPVHAWAAWRVYKIDGKGGKPDRSFLEVIFHKMVINFTWWVNRKDRQGRNVFQGGFLGLDNISLFDRSRPLPSGGYIDQCDGTSWMAFFCLGMLRISLELAQENPVYQDMATKFFEHFLRIAYAMTDTGGVGYALWNEEDGFFYDALNLPGGEVVPIKVRSLVGLLPLFAVETIEPHQLASAPVFERRMDWFLENRPILSSCMASTQTPGIGERRLLAIMTKEQLVRLLGYMLDENEFLSPYGIRSLSKFHEKSPYSLSIGGELYEIDYQPGESPSPLFGGNSNWRGPIWFPINYLIIESLQKFYHYYGDSLKVECPTGSGQYMNLWEVAGELSRRLISLFQRDESGKRPIFNGMEELQAEENLLFHEYFHAETGAGLGASHQTGWTSLIAKLIQQSGGEARLEAYLTVTGMERACKVPPKV